MDTSAWQAFFDRDDGNHAETTQVFKIMYERRILTMTTDYILDETLTLLRMRCGHRVAVEAGRAIQESSWITLVDVGKEIRHEAWRLFQKMSDQRFSFTDCTSFALMKRVGVHEAFAYDSDFERAGFTRVSLANLGSQ